MDSVVAGDFNTTLSQIDRSGKSKHVHDKAVKSLLNIMNDNNCMMCGEIKICIAKYIQESKLLKYF